MRVCQEPIFIKAEVPGAGVVGGVVIQGLYLKEPVTANGYVCGGGGGLEGGLGKVFHDNANASAAPYLTNASSGAYFLVDEILKIHA